MGPGDLSEEAAGLTSVLTLAQELIRFNTVNPPGNEEPAIRHLGAFLEQTGLDVEYQSLGPQRANLVARLRGTSVRQGHLVLCGHMDVVHPGTSSWEHDPFGATVVDGRLIGRGATDMKGGVAAMAVCLAELHEERLRPTADLILAITAGEEVDMAGAKLLDASGLLAGTTSVVIGEPTELNVYRAEKGVFWPKIIAKGHTAHGSMPHLGVNAISFVSRLIARLEAYPFPFEESEILGKPTLSVNVIGGGVKTNVVADECWIEVDMRLVPGQSRDETLSIINRIVSELKAEVPVEVRIEILQDAPALETKGSSPLVAAAVDAVRTVCEREPLQGRGCLRNGRGDDRAVPWSGYDHLRAGPTRSAAPAQ